MAQRYETDEKSTIMVQEAEEANKQVSSKSNVDDSVDTSKNKPQI